MFSRIHDRGVRPNGGGVVGHGTTGGIIVGQKRGTVVQPKRGGECPTDWGDGCVVVGVEKSDHGQHRTQRPAGDARRPALLVDELCGGLGGFETKPKAAQTGCELGHGLILFIDGTRGCNAIQLEGALTGCELADNLAQTPIVRFLMRPFSVRIFHSPRSPHKQGLGWTLSGRWEGGAKGG